MFLLSLPIGRCLRSIVLAIIGFAGSCAREVPRGGSADATPREAIFLDRSPAAPSPIGFLVEKTRRPVFSSPAGAVFEDGRPALSRIGDGLAPVPSTSMGALLAGAHIDLLDGRRWFLIEWPDSSGLRWEPPAHRREEIEAREAEMRRELLRLPAEWSAQISPRLRVIAAVSSAEGDFGGIATHAGDPAASLGIFQWAAERSGPVASDSSLARFFARLRAHDRRGDALAPLSAAAWRQCRDVGLDIRRGAVTWRSAAATGEVVERNLAAEMEREGGALRTMQLVIAWSELQQIAERRVTVGRAQRTVGEVLRSDRAFATAALLAINRPAWLVPSLSEALAAAPESTRETLRRGHALDDEEERALERELRRRALGRYRPKEREARAMRLLTSENLERGAD